MNADFMSILRCVIQAPSGHNTQPWKFRITEEGIAILPDFKRALSVVDGGSSGAIYQFRMCC